MKHKNYTLLSGFILFVGLICAPQGKLLAANIIRENPAGKLTPDDGKKHGKKEKSFRNQNVVKVYPDVFKKEIHVLARSTNERDIDFLVFDINGNMVLNYKMKAGEKRSIDNLKRGTYMYHVFSDDEFLTTGKLEFK